MLSRGVKAYILSEYVLAPWEDKEGLTSHLWIHVPMAHFPEAFDALRERRSPLVADAVGGDPEALSSLLEIARPVVLQWASTRTRDPDDAEDVTQLVLLRLYSKLSTFRGDSCLSSWLYRVTVNEASGFGRRKSRHQTQARLWKEMGEIEWVTEEDSNRIDLQRLAAAAREAASGLPYLQQTAFQLIDVDGYRPCEAARELGRTQTTIRSTLCRARKKIRELVEECHRELAREYLEE